MTTIQGLLVFLGTPLAIVGLIFAAVYATAPRGRRPEPHGPPVGTAVALNPCAVDADNGVERHVVAADDSGPRCWILACAECRTPYEEGRNAVHFTGPEHAVTVACAHGWVLTGHRMRCRNCS